VELRYLGFKQRDNARAYRFDVVEKGQPPKGFIVTADISLFHTHGVVIQEGPSLCANKLTADLKRDFDGAHELTAEDLLVYVNARSVAAAKRAGRRKAPGRRPSPAGERSPWRNSPGVRSPSGA